MRVFVTGAGGFLGRHLCRALASNGASVVAFVRHLDRADFGPDVRVAQGDIMDVGAVAAAIGGADAAVHLAARVHVMTGSATEELPEFRRVNVDATRIVAEAAVAARVRSFIFASSVKAVGEASVETWNSATPPNPLDGYGISKLEAERLLLTSLHENPTKLTVLRFPLVYGPGMRGNMSTLFRAVERRWPIPACVTNRRSMLFVGNAVAAIVRVLDRSLTGSSASVPPGPYFVADGPAQSTNLLVNEIGKALRKTPRILHLSPRVLRPLARLGDPFVDGKATMLIERLFGSLVVDEAEFELAYDFHPPFTREQGLQETAGWFRQR